MNDPVATLPEFPPLPGDWQQLGVCADSNLNEFYQENTYQQQRAFATCSLCPVQRQCLAYAIENRIVDGVWGGTNRPDRRGAKWDLEAAQDRAERRMRGDLANAAVRQRLIEEREALK